MSKMGCGYGSEYHLRWWIDNRAEELAGRVAAITGAAKLEWWNPPVLKGLGAPRKEWKGIAFVQAHPELAKKWKDFWPSSGNTLNWDAIGRLHGASRFEWALIEAKGHLGELRAACGAKEWGGLPLIRDSLECVKRSLGAGVQGDWLGDYYQYANRLACLWFLTENQIPAHLVYIYFLGDKRDDGAVCPATPGEWADAIKKEDTALGLPQRHSLSDRVHRLYLPVSPGADRLRAP